MGKDLEPFRAPGLIKVVERLAGLARSLDLIAVLTSTDLDSTAERA